MNFPINHNPVQTGSLFAAVLSCISLSACFGGPQASGHVEVPTPDQGAWPHTSVQNGRYFRYPAPASWKVSESTNGVDILSPDESEGINFVGLEGSIGSTTPKRTLEQIAHILRFTNLRYNEIHKRPFQNGFETAEFTFSATNSKGQPFEGWAWFSVNNSFGRYNFYADIACATTDKWQKNAQFLVAMARLINVINPQQAFQRDQLVRMRIPVGPGSAGGYNHPNTFTPYSQQAALDKINAQRSRVTRDDYPLVDPSTGTTYHGTSANYDYVRGGWVNPHDHTQLLTVVPPGQ